MIKKIILIIIGSFFLTLAAFCAAGYLFLKNVYETTPDAKELIDRSVAQTSIIYDRTGRNVLYEIFSDQNRKILSHDEIPDVVRVTAIAAEDDNFYSHKGFDLSSIARATSASSAR